MSEEQRDAGAALTVWFFDSAMGATAGQMRLRAVSPRVAVVLDTVTMSWMPGTHAPRVGRARRRGAAPRSSPLAAFATSLLRSGPDAAASGPDALPPGLGAVDREFLREMKARLVLGTSALLVLSTGTDLDGVRRVIERGRAHGEITLMHASLPNGTLVGSPDVGDPERPDRT